MISVFTDHISNRLQYVLDFCFTQRGFDYQLVTNKSDWLKVKSLRLNYSHEPLPCDYHITPHGLLFETSIRPDIQVSVKNDRVVMDDIPDDLALIFRFLSRYEEYLPHERDEHDRYKAANSELVKNELHRKPVADQLNRGIWEKLGLDYGLVEKGFECVPSFDIDVAWAYKNRKFMRSVGSALTKGNLVDRVKVSIGKKQDPYDTYNYIMEISARVKRIICFALLGNYSKYNKNIHWRNDAYGSLIRGLNAAGGMGLHPSYEAHLNSDILGEEIKRLEEIVGHEIVKSRQHFLRLRIPDSYELLIQQGIQRDFTMGYADEVGFRAGTSFPFYFFNLRTNQATNLLVFPFAYMDGVLKDRMKLTPQESMVLVESLAMAVKSVGGVLMFIWHNSSINDLDEWAGWKQVLEHTMKFAPEKDYSQFENDFFV